jgi:hypothetical protein
MRWLAGIFFFWIAGPHALTAQTWEVGGSVGYQFFQNVSVDGSSASGQTGFGRGFAAGALLGQNLYRFLGGEIRYTFLSDDLLVSSARTQATLGGQSQALHYDVLVHATHRNSSIRPFVAAGAGVKFYRGTGAEQAYQPLEALVVLTSISQIEPLVSIGGGVKFRLSQRALLRCDVRDQITPYPDKLLALPPGATKGSGWFHDVVAMIGISATFSREAVHQ